MEKLNLEEAKAKYEGILKRMKEAQKQRNENNVSEATVEQKKAYLLACIEEEKAKRELTKARKEFAEAIMTNFEEVDNNPYQERVEAKKERYQELADKNKAESQSRYNQSREMASYIPFGQPILVGHYSERRDRATRERISNGFEKSIELSKKAEYYQHKADKFGSNGISSDNKNAILELKNKYENVKGMYASAEKRRIIDRVISIYKNTIAPTKPAEEQGNGFTINRNTEINRIQILFDDIPNEETRKMLKSYGFRWSPFNKAWQRQLNSNGEWAVKAVREKLAQ